MRQREWKMQGVDVLDKGVGIYPIFKDFDTISFVSYLLYCMKDIRWIDQVYLYGRKTGSYFILYTKEDVEMNSIIEIMNATIESMKSQLEGIGRKINIMAYYNRPESKMSWELTYMYTNIKILVRALVKCDDKECHMRS